uniref:Uncharacterized protein LOC113798745 isoform X1 n=2 Tax=Dermatophagoides pteronyssinus TaxID=6956 RepID=A0A6P6YJQ4_DERPT|nr:uncharacterized protein LOC113798745 isoform X1 [Dermatophagoides pteronyssinus]
MMDSSKPPSSYLTLLDEISLEGLRGLTFPSLWIRLNDRDRYLASLNKPTVFGFDNSNELSKLKDFVLNVCLKESEKGNIQFYKTKNAQPTVQIYDRNQFVGQQTGTLLIDDSQVPDDLYPPVVGVKPTSDGSNSDLDTILGSCEDYHSRINITDEILNNRPENFHHFETKYEDQITQIVLVASQKLRAIALFGADRWSEYDRLKPECYLILESIGLKRWYGEINFGKETPQYLDSKIRTSFYYFRKILTEERLILTTTSALFKAKRQQITQAIVAYLPRFRPIMSNPNDSKMIALSHLFIQTGRNRLPLKNDVVREFFTQHFQMKNCAPLKLLRRIMERYSAFFRIYEDDQDDGIGIEYLRLLDKHPLHYDDFFRMVSSTIVQNDQDRNLDNGDGDGDDDIDDDNDNEDDDGLNVNMHDGNVLIDMEDDEFDDNDEDSEVFEQSQTKLLQQSCLDKLFDDYGIDIANAEDDPFVAVKLDTNFDYNAFFNRRKFEPFKALTEYPDSKASDSIVSIFDDADQNLIHVPTIQEVTQNYSKPLAMHIHDRLIQRNFLTSNHPYHSVTSCHSGEKLNLSLARLQQLPRYLDDRIQNLLAICGPCSKKKLANIFDLPISTIRLMLKGLKESGDITFTVKRIGRQFLHMFQSNISTIVQNPQSTIVDVAYQKRMTLVLEYIKRLGICDSFMWIRRYIVNCENPGQQQRLFSAQCDVKSIIRILNHLVDIGRVHLFHYELDYKQNYRNSYYVIYTADGQNHHLDRELEQHLILRSRFTWFARYPINLNTDVKCVDLIGSDKSGKIDFQTAVSRFFSTSQRFVDKKEEQKQIENNDSIDDLIPNTRLAYCPASSAYLYGCRHSKLDKMFDLYRFLFHVLIDQSSVDSCQVQDENEHDNDLDWQKRVPKLTFLQASFSPLDILPYIPLSVYRNLVTIRFEIPELDSYLNDPSKRHLMLQEIPPVMRSHLLHNRRSPLDIQESLQSLHQMGLINLLLSDDKAQQFDKKFIHRFRYRLNRFILVRKYQFLEQDIDTMADEEPTMVEYYFNKIADFDRFVDVVYDHLCQQPLKPCNKCLFDDGRIDIHALYNPQSSKHHRLALERQNIREQQSHKRKRKQDLRPLKNKRIKVQVMIDGKPVERIRKKVIDTVDEQQMEVADSLRIQWSREEDRFILRCRLLSELLDVPYTRRFIIHSQKISDLMLQYCGPQSKDKTAGACIRRIVRLISQPHIKRILSICKMELVSNLTCLHSDSDENQQKSCEKDRFIRFLPEIMSYKFRNTEYFMTKDDIRSQSQTQFDIHFDEQITIEELLSRYDIIDPESDESKDYYLDPKNYYDIHGYVITNVLISSLFSFHIHHHREPLRNKDEQLFFQRLQPKSKYLRRFYLRTIFRAALRRYPETLMKLILKRLVRYRLLSNNKKLKGNDRRLFPCGYKLAQQFYRPLLVNHRNYQLKVECQQHPTTNITIVEDNNTFVGSMQFAENLCINTLSLNDPQAVSLSSSSSIQLTKDINQWQFGDLLPPRLLETIDFHIEIPDNFIAFTRGSIDQSRLPAKTNARGMLMMNRSSNQSMQSTTENKETVSSSSSSLIDEMSVIHCRVKIEQKSANPPVNRIILFEKFLYRFTIQSQIFDEQDIPLRSMMKPDESIPLNLIKRYEENVCTILNMNEHHSNLKDLLQFIRSKKELGANFIQINNFLSITDDALEKEILIDFLYECQKHKLLFAVGVRTLTWVHCDHIRFWLVRSFRNLDFNVDRLIALDRCQLKHLKKCYFLPRMWKYPDGHVDVRTLFVFLSAIIDYLATDSNASIGANVSQLENHFQRHLPPVQLQELLDALVFIDCIRKSSPLSSTMTTTNQPKINSINTLDDFFRPNRSPSSSLLITNNIKNDIMYESNIDAYSRLTSLYQIMIRLYPPFPQDDF